MVSFVFHRLNHRFWCVCLLLLCCFSALLLFWSRLMFFYAASRVLLLLFCCFLLPVLLLWLFFFKQQSDALPTELWPAWKPACCIGGHSIQKWIPSEWTRSPGGRIWTSAGLLLHELKSCTSLTHPGIGLVKVQNCNHSVQIWECPTMLSHSLLWLPLTHVDY